MSHRVRVYVCKRCGEAFERTQPSTFCTLVCCWAWRRENKDKLKGTFPQGLQPWNKGTKGVMKPNSGTFQKGRESDAKLAVGAVTIRNDKQGKPRAWVKVSDNGDPYDWVLRAVVVWESANGSVPDGYVVHHKNRNTMDDNIGNLELLSRGDHLSEHRHEFEEKRNALAIEGRRRKRNATK